MSEGRGPNPAALHVAALLKERLGQRDEAPVRVAFVGSTEAAQHRDEMPPMTSLLRSGRGSDLRLKLELSFLWVAVNPPHDLVMPARVWAQLLGLEDPEGRGTRRVRQAISALADRNLVAVNSRAGQPNRVLLLEESGTGQPYMIPGRAYNQARSTGEVWRHRYIRVPDTLWTNGWIATLSGPALAMLLILLVELGQKDPETSYLWISPAQAAKTYRLSDDTRSKGLRELQDLGLVEVRRRAAGRDVLDFRRMRNTYRLRLDQLEQTAFDIAGRASTTRPRTP